MKKKTILAFIAAAMLTAGVSALPVAAEDYPTEEEIIDTIWEDWWYGEPEDGTTFPEGSYERHVITEWVADNYEEIKGDVSYAVYQYRQYYKDMTDEWSFKDDDNGNFYIADLDGNPIYHFNFVDGKWNMADENGNVVDSFMPFSTLDEEEDDYNPEDDESDEEYDEDSDMPQAEQAVTAEQRATQNINRSDDTNNSVHRVTGTIAPEVQAETAVTTSATSEKENTNNGWKYGVAIGGVAVVAVAGGLYYKSRKGKQKK